MSEDQGFAVIERVISPVADIWRVDANQVIALAKEIEVNLAQLTSEEETAYRDAYTLLAEKVAEWVTSGETLTFDTLATIIGSISVPA